MTTYEIEHLVAAVKRARYRVSRGPRGSLTTGRQNGIDFLVTEISYDLADDNPNFDREEFLKATETIPGGK